MEVFLPPSSIRHGFNAFPHVDAIMDPTAVLPVKLIFLTAGCSIKAVVMTGASSGLYARILSTPAGKPASWKALPMAQKQRGDSSEAFRTVVFPAAIA